MLSRQVKLVKLQTVQVIKSHLNYTLRRKKIPYPLFSLFLVLAKNEWTSPLESWFFPKLHQSFHLPMEVSLHK